MWSAFRPMRAVTLSLFLAVVGCQHGQPAKRPSTVEQAYRAIPHRQTTYQKAVSALPRTEAEQLEEFFGAVDLAIVQRVQAFHDLHSDSTSVEEQLNELERLAAMLRTRPAAPHTEIAQLVASAIDDQRTYLKSVAEGDRRQIYAFASDAHVRSASAKLIQAYQFLLQRYPEESAANRQAFFDHLCALDFM